MNPVTRPGCTEKDIPSRATVSPYLLRTLVISIVAVVTALLYDSAGVSDVSPADTALTPGSWHRVRMRVLVVEDFEVLAVSIGTGLRREGMAVDVVLDGTEALSRLAGTRYDVVVLDRDLPGVSGDDVCRSIVADESGSRVLMLTASSTVRDRVEGLGLGADDYLAKPFDFSELVARVRALARRSTPAAPPTLEAGGVSLDSSRRVAFRDGRRLDLSPKEFALLECLLAASGRVVSAEELLERVWDEMADPFTTAVKTTMRRLRAKLGDPPLIDTVREGGYRIGAPR
jgi:DNA-binding response OmpR family regulator